MLEVSLLYLAIFVIFVFFLSITAHSTTAATGNSSETLYDALTGWGINAVGAFAAAGGLIFTGYSLRKEALSRYAQDLTQIDHELNSLYNEHNALVKEGKRETAAMRNWQLRYINMMNRLATLIHSRHYPRKVLDIYKLDFQWAKFLIQHHPKRNDITPYYKDILKLCDDNKLEGIDLPEFLSSGSTNSRS